MKGSHVRKAIFFTLIFFSTVFFHSCDNTFDDYIPYAPVNLYIDLTINNQLQIPGSSMIFPGGYGGVIVYNNFGEYIAYDAACTLEIDQNCILSNEDNGPVVTCPCCESKFFLYDGAPIDGDAIRFMKKYKAVLSGDRVLISN